MSASTPQRVSSSSQQATPLSPFHPASPMSSRPAASRPLRGPALLRLKVSSFALVLLVIFRQLELYKVWRRVSAHLGVSHSVTDSLETTVVVLLLVNIVQAWRKLQRNPEGAKVTPSTMPPAGRLGTPLRMDFHRGSPKVSSRRFAHSSRRTLARSFVRWSVFDKSRVSSSVASSRRRSVCQTRASVPSSLSSPSFLPSSPSPSTPGTKLRPRYSLSSSSLSASSFQTPSPLKPSSSSLTSIPHNSPTPTKSLKSALASSTRSPKAEPALSASMTTGKGKEEGTPLKMYKLRHSLGSSTTSSPSLGSVDSWSLGMD